MKVRKVTRADGKALLEIDRLTWSELSSPGPPPEGAFDLEGVLVADDDGAVAGYVKLRHPTPFESSRHVVEIAGLAVHPECRRRGVARALLAAAVDEAGRMGARRLTLRVFEPNTAARALYESEGFAVEGVLRGEFLRGGRYVDDVLMAKPVEPRDTP